jgi:F-type H+-transporting ATPase subunit epsilon
MADTFQFRLVTPTGIVFEGPIEQAIAVGPLGEFGVLAGHTDFITSLTPGMLTLKPASGAPNEYLLTGGLAEVKDGAMSVLALEALNPASVDSAAAASDEQAAEDRLAQLSFYDAGYSEAEQALQLARARHHISELSRVSH